MEPADAPTLSVSSTVTRDGTSLHLPSGQYLRILTGVGAAGLAGFMTTCTVADLKRWRAPGGAPISRLSTRSATLAASAPPP
ncbi:hypothetical protein N657DRAFT_645763 [Parathielavia appendiculata]|uniref:Uncharacterized protein n=1 Tax=Parathielavia appendiculata TaxID=2587402 RepID=A0AAN6TYF6_9PEZI|nr:hypothetical protein N657DRAFT_645763 [Parathielavia appendiculata]